MSAVPSMCSPTLRSVEPAHQPCAPSPTAPPPSIHHAIIATAPVAPSTVFAKLAPTTAATTPPGLHTQEQPSNLRTAAASAVRPARRLTLHRRRPPPASLPALPRPQPSPLPLPHSSNAAVAGDSEPARPETMGDGSHSTHVAEDMARPISAPVLAPTAYMSSPNRPQQPTAAADSVHFGASARPPVMPAVAGTSTTASASSVAVTPTAASAPTAAAASVASTITSDATSAGHPVSPPVGTTDPRRHREPAESTARLARLARAPRHTRTRAQACRLIALPLEGHLSFIASTTRSRPPWRGTNRMRLSVLLRG